MVKVMIRLTWTAHGTQAQ